MMIASSDQGNDGPKRLSEKSKAACFHAQASLVRRDEDATGF